MNTARRADLMQRWWGWHPYKPLWLQNGVGRLLCLRYGHEYSRSHWCDWCGHDR